LIQPHENMDALPDENIWDTNGSSLLLVMNKKLSRSANVDNVVTLSHLKFRLEWLEGDREEEKARYQDKIAGMEATSMRGSSKSIAHAEWSIPCSKIKPNQNFKHFLPTPQENAQEGSHRVAQKERGS